MSVFPPVPGTSNIVSYATPTTSSMSMSTCATSALLDFSMSMLWYMFKRNRGSSRLIGIGSVTVQNGSHDTILEMSLSQSTTTEVFFALLRAALLVAVEGRVGERQMSSKKE